MLKAKWLNLLVSKSAFVVAALALSCLPPPVRAAVAPQGPATTFRWPDVVPESFSWHFAPGVAKDVRVQISGPSGIALYLIECHTPDFKQDDFDYSGIYQCRLESQLHFTSGQDLFAEGPFVERQYDSIAVFSRSDLQAGSATRRALVRGMDISFGFRNAHGDSDGLSFFDFWLNVRPDKNAWASICCSSPSVAPASHPEWPRIQKAQGQFSVSERSPRDGVITAAGVWQMNGSPDGTLIIPVVQADGAQIYSIRCAAYSNYAERDSTGHPRLGVVCGLYTKDGINLLASATDPVSRLNPEYILPEQLTSACEAYPGWGANRDFRLRGMDVIMSLTHSTLREDQFDGVGTHLVFPPLLVEAELSVEVRPDPNAADAQPSPPKTVYWGVVPSANPCSHILYR